MVDFAHLCDNAYGNNLKRLVYNILFDFIFFNLRNIQITAIDIDETMLTIATNYFDLKPDNNLKVLIDDGIIFLQKSAEKGRYF